MRKNIKNNIFSGKNSTNWIAIKVRMLKKFTSNKKVLINANEI